MPECAEPCLLLPGMAIHLSHAHTPSPMLHLNPVLSPLHLRAFVFLSLSELLQWKNKKDRLGEGGGGHMQKCAKVDAGRPGNGSEVIS